MSDLVERLRFGVLKDWDDECKIRAEAADEIELLREINEGRMLDILSNENVRMRAEIERLRTGLRAEAVRGCDSPYQPRPCSCRSCWAHRLVTDPEEDQ